VPCRILALLHLRVCATQPRRCLSAGSLDEQRRARLISARQGCADRDHRLAAIVDRLDDLGVVDALQADRGDAEVCCGPAGGLSHRREAGGKSSPVWISPTTTMSWPELSRSAVTPRAETAGSLEVSTAATREAAFTRQPRDEVTPRHDIARVARLPRSGNEHRACPSPSIQVCSERRPACVHRRSGDIEEMTLNFCAGRASRTHLNRTAKAESAVGDGPCRARVSASAADCDPDARPDQVRPR
jgi:hypothetical protein